MFCSVEPDNSSHDEVCSHACYFDESAPSSVSFEKIDKNVPWS